MSENLIHRDDLDMETVGDIEKFFADKFPGMKVVFAGDRPGELAQDMQESLKALEAVHESSLMYGTCIDCGVEMPDYPRGKDEDFSEEWQPAKGWTWFTKHGTDEPMCWQCPSCDASESIDSPEDKPLS